MLAAGALSCSKDHQLLPDMDAIKEGVAGVMEIVDEVQSDEEESDDASAESPAPSESTGSAVATTAGGSATSRKATVVNGTFEITE